MSDACIIDVSATIIGSIDLIQIVWTLNFEGNHISSVMFGISKTHSMGERTCSSDGFQTYHVPYLPSIHDLARGSTISPPVEPTLRLAKGTSTENPPFFAFQ